MRDTILRLTVICGCVLLVFQSSALAQQSADRPPLVKTSITIDSEKLVAGKPAVVTVTIENISDREIEVDSPGSFDLKSLSEEALSRKHGAVIGDGYWSPVNISTGTPLGLKIIDPKKLKKGVVVGQVPRAPLKFAKSETKTFKVDLAKVFWNDSILSGWPADPLFEVVPKGSYALTFDLRDARGVKSNEIKVSLN
jgi:hypothetical protein